MLAKAVSFQKKDMKNLELMQTVMASCPILIALPLANRVVEMTKIKMRNGGNVMALQYSLIQPKSHRPLHQNRSHLQLASFETYALNLDP